VVTYRSLFSFPGARKACWALARALQRLTRRQKFPSEESRSEKNCRDAGASHVIALTRSGNTLVSGDKEFAGLASSLRRQFSRRGAHCAVASNVSNPRPTTRFEWPRNSSTCIVQVCAGMTTLFLYRACILFRNSRLGLGELQLTWLVSQTAL
jgi:hypothetical protein